MVEGCVFNEALGLCTKYMQTFDVTKRRSWDDNEEGMVGKGFGRVPKSRQLKKQLQDATYL